MHAGTAVQLPGVVGIVVPDQLDDLRVDLDRVDVPDSVIGRLLHGAAAAGAKHQYLFDGRQEVGQCRGLHVEVAERHLTGVVIDGLGPLAIDEDADLVGNARMAQQGLAQPLVGRELRLQPRPGHDGQHYRGRQHDRLPGAPPTAGQLVRRDQCRQQAEQGDGPQGVVRQQQEQQGDDKQAAGTRAQQVGGVGARHGITVAHQCQGNTAGGKKEGQGMQQVERCQVERLLPVPEDLLGVERHLPCEQVAAERGDAEQHQGERVNGVKARQQGAAGEGDERAAGAVTEQGQADDHPGEMMPLAYGEQPHQKDLVAERGRRDECNGQEGRAGGPG